MAVDGVDGEGDSVDEFLHFTCSAQSRSVRPDRVSRIGLLLESKKNANYFSVFENCQSKQRK